MIEYIGFDVGGTNIRIGAIDKNNKLGHIYEESVLTSVNTLDDFLAKVIRLVERVPGHENCKAICIGFPGMIVDNLIKTCRNITMLIDFPLAAKLEEYFKKPVYIENDAKMAALGEALMGAAQNGKNICYVGLGTGVGGAVVMNKQLYMGSSNLGGYFSRIILDGENQCENLISGTGLLSQAKKVYKNVKSTTEFFNIVQGRNNKKAKAILEKFKKNFVNLLLNISVTLNPDTIVVGGGVMRAGSFFFDEVRARFKELAHSQAKETNIIPVGLEQPGILGSALYAKQCFAKNKKEK